MKPHSYHKTEKLKSRKRIEQLFKEGRALSAFPVKIIYQLVQPVGPLQAGVAVSSKNFRKAVHRNRVKRVLREAYRLQKHLLQQPAKQQDGQLVLFIIYTGRELPIFSEVFEKVGMLLQRLAAVLHGPK